MALHNSLRPASFVRKLVPDVPSLMRFAATTENSQDEICRHTQLFPPRREHLGA